MRRYLLPLIFACTLLLGLAGALPARAQSKSLYWERFDVDLTVLPNGDLQVVERQVIQFVSGTFQEGFAELVTRNTDGIDGVQLSESGTPYRQVSACCSQPGEYAVEELENGNLQVTWSMGPTRDMQRTFELAYTAHGVIRRYPEGDEFQWVAISPGLHDFEIRASRVRLRMPAGATLSLADYMDNSDFNGVPMQVAVAADGEGATWEALNWLFPVEGVQVVVQFKGGVVGGGKPAWQADFDRRAAWDQTYRPLADVLLFLCGGLLLTGGPVALYLLWFLAGRDPRAGVVPEYVTQPPPGIPPGIAGTLVDERADTADIIATLFDLARRGYLEIVEVELPKKKALGRDFVLRRAAGGPSEAGLEEYERSLLKAALAGQSEARLRDLYRKFYVHLDRLETQLYEAAVRHGYFGQSPEAVRARYSGLGRSLLTLGLVGGFFTVAALSNWATMIFCPFPPLAALGIAMIWLGQHMPSKTRKGSEAAALCRAFKNYLANLERYSDARQAVDQFERYLPYAIAFGLERSWINRFKAIPETPAPVWYRPWVRPSLAGRTAAAGAQGEAPSLQSASDAVSGGLQSMSDSLNTLLNSAAATLTSRPPSSSSSGGRSYSGGGFRGGGGSGGGARGFR